MKKNQLKELEDTIAKTCSFLKKDCPGEWIVFSVENDDGRFDYTLPNQYRFYFFEVLDKLSKIDSTFKEISKRELENIAIGLLRENILEGSIDTKFKEIKNYLKNHDAQQFTTFKPLWETVSVSRWERGKIKILSLEEFRKEMKSFEKTGPQTLSSIENVIHPKSLSTKTFVSYTNSGKHHEKFLEESNRAFFLFENIIRFLEGPHSYSHFSVFHRQAPRVWGELYMTKESGGWTAEGNTLKRNIDFMKLLDKSKELDILIDFATEASKPNKYQERIITAASTLGSSYLEKDNDGAFLKAMMALESLFTNSSNDQLLSPSITEQLSTTVAFLLSDKLEERKILFKALKKAYGLRSKIVHGGGAHVDKDTFLSTAIIVEDVIKNLIMHSECKQFTSFNDLQEWVIDKKLK